MKILYHHRTQGEGAEGNHIRSVVNALTELGHQVVVLSPPGVNDVGHERKITAESPRGTGGRVRKILSGVAKGAPKIIFEILEIFYNVVALVRLSRMLRKERFDFVYERYAMYMMAGAFLCKRKNLPFVLEMNEVSGMKLRVRQQKFKLLAGYFEKMITKRSTAIHVVSSELRRILIERGVEKESIYVNPNGIDAKTINVIKSKEEIKDALSRHQGKVIGFVGLFAEWDRLDSLIRTLAVLKDRHPSLKLVLVGDGPVIEDLKGLVKKMNLEKDVLFTGRVDRQNALAYMSGFDMMVLPHSNNYGSPMVMFEAMALKTPIVAPKLPPILDVHTDESSALLFETLDEDRMAQKIEMLLNDEALAQKIADRSYELVMNRYTWERNVRSVIDSVSQGAGLRCST
jgi:glycosyltransferase involved in cell wall biosynthesis